MVADYKKNFNWQDRFDHFLASIGSSITLKKKADRMFVCAFQMSLVKAWGRLR